MCGGGRGGTACLIRGEVVRLSTTRHECRTELGCDVLLVYRPVTVFAGPEAPSGRVARGGSSSLD